MSNACMVGADLRVWPLSVGRGHTRRSAPTLYSSSRVLWRSRCGLRGRGANRQRLEISVEFDFERDGDGLRTVQYRLLPALRYLAGDPLVASLERQRIDDQKLFAALEVRKKAAQIRVIAEDRRLDAEIRIDFRLLVPVRSQLRIAVLVELLFVGRFPAVVGVADEYLVRGAEGVNFIDNLRHSAFVGSQVAFEAAQAFQNLFGVGSLRQALLLIIILLFDRRLHGLYLFIAGRHHVAERQDFVGVEERDGGREEDCGAHERDFDDAQTRAADGAAHTAESLGKVRLQIHCFFSAT